MVAPSVLACPLLLCAAANALLATPRRLPARARRAPVLRACTNETLTVGDVVGDALAAGLSRRISNLPNDEQAERAERTLDAMLAASSAELDALQQQLEADLAAQGLNTTVTISKSMARVEEVAAATLEIAAEKLEPVLAPNREGVRAGLEQIEADRDAEREARELRRENQKAFTRARTWRDERALARQAGKPKHPVVLACEASSLVLGLGFVLLFSDAAVLKSYVLTSPPKVSRDLTCIQGVT